MWTYNHTSELYHHGVKGMRWGIRRARKPAASEAHDDYKKAHDKKSVKEMSDAELRNRNNRLQMEQQYANLTKKKSRGKEIVQTFISTAGTIAAVAGAYKTYKGLANGALDRIGNKVLSDINLRGPLTL